MLKTDLMELKKTLKKDRVTISRMFACYVSGENKDKSIQTASFLNLPDDEFYKYLELIKKMMSCKAGDTLQTLSLKNEDTKKALDSLRSTELKQESIAESVSDQIIKNFEYINNYLILMFFSAYDVPAKGSDKLKQDESEYVYDSIYCLICPMELSDPGLAYHEDKHEIHVRIRDWVVSSPTVGFIYPDYHNREIDTSKVVYAVCNKKNTHKELVDKLFGQQNLVTKELHEQAIAVALNEALENTSFDEVASVMNKMAAKVKSKEERAEEQKAKRKDQESLTTEEIVQVIEECDLPEEKSEQFVSAYKSAVNHIDEKPTVKKISKSNKIKCEDIDISVPAEKMKSVRIDHIQGKRCVIIELSEEDSDVVVNGITCQ